MIILNTSTHFKKIRDTQGDSTKLAVSMDVTKRKSLQQNRQTTENWSSPKF